MDKCWKINNKSSDYSELLFYGDIVSDSWNEDDVTPTNLINDLNEMKDINTLKVRINSNGGNVFAGNAIKNTLERFGKDNDVGIEVYIDGIAASIASVIAMAGDTIYMPSNSLLMIHNPWMMASGNSEDFRKIADDLDVIRESLISAYQDKVDLGRQTIIDYMDKETWFTANEAVSLGFADEIESREVAAKVRDNKVVMNDMEFSLEDYNNVPDKLIKNIGVNDKNVNKNNYDDVNNKTQGGKQMDLYRKFETKDELETFKNDIKEEARNGYFAKEDVLNKFDFDVEDIDELANEVNDMKTEHEELQNKIKEGKEIADKKEMLDNAGLTIEDLDMEEDKELLNMSEEAINSVITVANKKNEEIEEIKNSVDQDDVDEEDNFNPNFNLEDTDDVVNIAQSL